MKKITMGMVIQECDKNGKCISCTFKEGGQVHWWEDEQGNVTNMPSGWDNFPIEMVQPPVEEGATKPNLRNDFLICPKCKKSDMIFVEVVASTTGDMVIYDCNCKRCNMEVFSEHLDG